MFAVWKSTSIATPSNRRRVDGVDVDAKIQRERAINFDFHTGCLKAVRASTPGSSPSAASAGSSRSSSSARRPRSSSGPRPSRSRASTATTTARSTPASGCSERNSDHISSTGYVIRHLSPRAGHQGIDRTRPGHQGRPAARARLHMYIVGSLTRACPVPLTVRGMYFISRLWAFQVLSVYGRNLVCRGASPIL